MFSYDVFHMKYETQKLHFSYKNFILTTLVPAFLSHYQLEVYQMPKQSSLNHLQTV